MNTPVAVVTGASRGIGRAIALRFAEEGMNVWALARSVDALETLAKEAPRPHSIRPLKMDAANHDELHQACQTILAQGTPFILVNNAGIASSSSLEQTDLSIFERTMAVNVTAPFLLCRELMPHMAQQGGGRIINIASTAALRGYKYTAAYCASKHALLGLTRSLAVEYGAKNVTVNAICPGWTDTDMLASAVSNISGRTGKTPEQARDLLAQMNPMKRLVTPEEVAALCVFLASPHAQTVTGAAYSMDGGETA